MNRGKSAFHFQKSRRLLSSSEYSTVFDKNQFRASGRYFLLLAYRAPGSGPGTHQRLGLVIGKKNLRLASQRNRVKRIARELFRQQDQQSLPNLDLVLIARKGLEKLSNAEIRNILEPLFQKIYQQASQTNAEAPDYH